MDDERIELERFIGQIDKKLSIIEEKVTRLDHAVLGNGKPGLLEDHRRLETCVQNHLREAEKAALKKASIDTKAWAIFLLAVGQLFIIIRNLIGF